MHRFTVAAASEINLARAHTHTYVQMPTGAHESAQCFLTLFQKTTFTSTQMGNNAPAIYACSRTVDPSLSCFANVHAKCKAYRRIQLMARPPPRDRILARFEARTWDLILSRMRRDASEGGMPMGASVTLPVVMGICARVCVCRSI